MKINSYYPRAVIAQNETPKPDVLRDRLWLGALCVSMLALYGSTLCRTVYWYDSAEFATAAAVLGIPHPPGYPLYTLLGKLYVSVVPGEPAFAVNLMSAVHGALAVGLLFLLQRRLGADRRAALLGSLFLATGPSLWQNCVIAEVYTTGLVFALAVFLLLLHGIETQRPRWLVGAAFVGGLGFSAHMFVATLGLGYVWLVWHGSRSAMSSEARQPVWKVLGRATLAALAGASMYLYVPLRASQKPALDSMGVDSPTMFFWMVTGGNYKTWFLKDYDVLDRALYVYSLITEHLTLLGVALSVLGVCVLMLRRRAFAIAIILAAAGNLWFFFAYKVHDVEVFFLPTAVVLAACIGPAECEMRTFLSRTRATRIIANIASAVCFAYVALRMVIVYPSVDYSRDRSARLYGEALVSALPPQAVFLDFTSPPEWKNKAVFAYYFQKALGLRPDVITVEMPPPAILKRIFDSGRPVFMYAPVGLLDGVVELTEEGPLLRAHLRAPLP